MLRIFNEFYTIDFKKLMTVYEESNRDNAEEFYPNEETNLAIMYAEQDFYMYLQEEFFCREGAFYAVWELNGDYVSALRMEPYKDGLLLEALETAPQHRKKGYATVLLKTVLRKLEEQGRCTVYSHVNKRNIASLRTHCSSGFHRVLDHAVFIDGSVKQNSYTLIYCALP